MKKGCAKVLPNFRSGHGANSDNNSEVVTVRNGASFVMLDGSRITGNTVGGRLGTPRDVLIHNDNGVTFTQTGGTIDVLDNRRNP
ncbi:MAG: hypothetical protein FWC97_11375 [Treponema sp.]|nr:hypothetical protein [Treponema sp.]